MLLPSRDVGKPKSTRDNTNILSLARFEKEMRGIGTLYVLIGKEVSEEVKISEVVASLIKEFRDVCLDELPNGLPPLWDIQHQIDLEPGVMLPNRAHYGMSHSEHEDFRR